MTTESVFAAKHLEKYKYRYHMTVIVDRLVAGIPTNRNAVEGWLKKNLGADNADLLGELVAKTMIETGAERDDAVDKVAAELKLNAFKRDEHGLYFEGRNVKAAIKEASNICWPKRSWGPTRKGTKSYWEEHVFVEGEHDRDRIPLGITEAPVQQRFVHTWRGSGIQNEEYVDDAKLSFVIITDAGPDVITDDDWAELWTCGEQQGIGASRGVGYGRYTVIDWTRL